MNFLDRFHNWRRQQRWNRQYKSGRWDKLKDDIEAVRYQKIIDYTVEFGPENASILDLGCGEGILAERMASTKYSYFLGMDFSSVSIAKANHLTLRNTEFICADIHNFQPKQTFDVIIFNEVFYYIHETEKQNVMDRMIACLNDNGIIITSIYREGLGCWKYFDQLDQLNFESITTTNENTYWKVGVYRK